MSWAKLDDGYCDNPKMLAVGLLGTGLHARAISYCARHETDGKVPLAWVMGQLVDLKPADRKNVLDALERVGLFTRENGGYVVNDYLDYNPSRAALEAKREAERKRKGVTT